MYGKLTESRVQVRSNCIIAYEKYIGQKSITQLLRRQVNMRLQQQKAYSGAITKGAQKRITRAVNLLILTAKERWIWNEVTGREQKHKLSFITLTVSDNTKNLDAREAYDKLLRPWLQWATRTKGVKTYIWKAELQKRGQIHYHITTHSFLNWKEIRDKWNYLQRINGLLDDFYNRFKHYNPNSTDVHEVYKKSDLTSYLIKYIAKAESQKEKTNGKIWDCSQNLKGTNYPDYEITNEQNKYLEYLQRQGWLRVKYATQCSIIKIPSLPGKELLCESLYNECTNYLNTIATATETNRKKLRSHPTGRQPC